MEIVHLEKINFKYEEKSVFEDACFTANRGELILVCGKTGSGKSTLLKIIKHNVENSAYVPQNPDAGIVCEKVIEELAFTLGNRGERKNYINGRIGEIAGFFGISDWLYKDTHTLSGGEKQILNIAAAMVENPKILLLDEPDAMLDPVMSQRLGDLIKRINKELGVTVIIAEHRPENYFAQASSVALIDRKKILINNPEEMAAFMADNNEYEKMLPVYAGIFPDKKENPLSFEQAALSLSKYIVKKITINDKVSVSGETVLSAKNLVFGYERSNRIIDGVSLELREGEMAALLGENGSGKTTLAGLLMGNYRPYTGKIMCRTNKAMLCQDVTLHFTGNEETEPYDLSGGQRQLFALEKVLEDRPGFLILDEPTKGLDIYEKEKLAQKLMELKAQKTSILLITHDVEFAAMYSDRMLLLFGKKIIKDCSSRKFCRENMIYTTAVSRLYAGIDENVYTSEQAKDTIGELK